MKTRYLQIGILIILFVHFTSAIGQNQSKENAKTSVVKIKTTYLSRVNGIEEKELGNATGWCWKEPTLVVTALHAVTGASEIKVYNSKGVMSTATVIKVILEADMALLRLNTNLGLNPLTLKEANSNSEDVFWVWGFPQGVLTMQGDDIRFSLSLETTPTLNDILTGTNTKLKRELEKQTYPMPYAQIYRISSTIQPGHSGAPIMTREGSVIGMADGGLREGVARINWAMPASHYVPRLLNSADQLPRSPSLQSSLYSMRTKVELNATEEEQNNEVRKEVTENTKAIGNKSVTKTWTASYNDIISTLSTEDQQELIGVLQSFQVNVSDTQYDIYEDFETGATIVVPFGESFEVQDGWFYTSTDDLSLEYEAFPFIFDSYENAKKEVFTIFKEDYPANEWAMEPIQDGDIEEDDEYETASYYITATALDGTGDKLTFMAEVDGASLLVVNLIHNDEEMVNYEYRKKYIHYLLAIQMCAFGEN